MTKFRHLIWMLIAASGLALSASQSQAQLRQPDVGDQPGLVADDSVELDPEFRKTAVLYRTNEAPGTIIVQTAERHLYLIQGNGRALRYGIGVGREGFQWQGLVNITRKAEWPDWTPPPEMIARQPYLPRFMAGGPGNPLGARAMYLGTTVYRIHGTNRPDTIGTAVSSGCFRLVNTDVADLYEHVPVGTKVSRPPRGAGRRDPAGEWCHPPSGGCSPTPSRDPQSCQCSRPAAAAPPHRESRQLPCTGRRRSSTLRQLTPTIASIWPVWMSDMTIALPSATSTA